MILSFSILASFLTIAQQKPYNKQFPYAIIRNSETLEKIDSIQALIVNFESIELADFCKSLYNNPQIKEVQLYNTPQSALDSLSSILGHSLTHLITEEYSASSMYLNPFEALDMLSVNSDVILTLDISKARLDLVNILTVSSNSLISWKTQQHFPELGLIDLEAPKLSALDIKSAPKLNQFSYHCSFEEIPKFLCACVQLELISFANYKVVPVDDCFKEKMSKAFYSDITISEGENGKVVFELLSDDRKE